MLQLRISIIDSGMGCNGRTEHFPKQVVEEKKGLKQMDYDDNDDGELVSVKVDVKSQDEVEDCKPNLEQKSSHATPLPQRGLCLLAHSKSVSSVRLLGSN